MAVLVIGAVTVTAAVGAGLSTLSLEFDWDVACSKVTASLSGLHCTTASHFPRPLFFFFRLKKQQHLDKQANNLNNKHEKIRILRLK